MLFSLKHTDTLKGMASYRETLSHDAALLHTSWSAKFPHVVAVLAVATLLSAAGSTALAPHPPAPQSRDGRAFGWPLMLVEGGTQARTVNNRWRGSGGLVPWWLYEISSKMVEKQVSTLQCTETFPFTSNEPKHVTYLFSAHPFRPFDNWLSSVD